MAVVFVFSCMYFIERLHKSRPQYIVQRQQIVPIKFNIKWRPSLAFHWLILNAGSVANRMRQKWFNYSTVLACQHVHIHTDKTLRKYTHHKSAVLSVSIWLFHLSLTLSFGSYSPIPHSSIHCLLLQSSLSLTSLLCTLPQACHPHFFFSIHASRSLLIICDLLKYIHRFTLLFYASCFLFTQRDLFFHHHPRSLSFHLLFFLLFFLSPCFLSLVHGQVKGSPWFSFYTESIIVIILSPAHIVGSMESISSVLMN